MQLLIGLAFITAPSYHTRIATAEDVRDVNKSANKGFYHERDDTLLNCRY
jgi:hypothetical protein